MALRVRGLRHEGSPKCSFVMAARSFGFILTVCLIYCHGMNCQNFAPKSPPGQLVAKPTLYFVRLGRLHTDSVIDTPKKATTKPKSQKRGVTFEDGRGLAENGRGDLIFEDDRDVVSRNKMGLGNGGLKFDLRIKYEVERMSPSTRKKLRLKAPNNHKMMIEVPKKTPPNKPQPG